MTASATVQRQSASRQDDDLLDNVIDNTNAALQREIALLRMENETISTECRLRPRNMGDIRAKLSELLKEFPDFADEAIYCKPVGREDGGSQQKYAKGLSIRAAEALAEAYGYNRVRADITKIDDFTVKIDATFTDFQTGRIWQDGGIISKFYTTRNKQRATHSDDRFYNVVVKAEKSKYLREVICRSVNSALKAWFEAECAKVAGQRISPADIDKVIAAWKKSGVELHHLEYAVGHTRSMGWTSDDLALLRGIWTALRDGETTLAEAFGIQQQESKKDTTPTGPVSSDDLANPKMPSTPDPLTGFIEQVQSYTDRAKLAKLREDVEVAPEYEVRRGEYLSIIETRDNELREKQGRGPKAKGQKTLA